MGWKNIKDHYRIGHIVQIRDGRIAVGSGYVSDLIRVSFDGNVSWGNLGASKNDDLARYYAEMTADPKKLKELIDMPDTFTESLTVYTYDGGEIIEKKCEAYGWPNLTHDGQLQYENMHSADKLMVVKWAKQDSKLGIKAALERIAEIKKDLKKVEDWHSKEVSDLEKLERDFPESKA